MRVILVGADLEENLGVGMVAAAAEHAGHEVAVAPYTEASQLRALGDRILAAAPEVVGLSIQFQHRAAEFLSLAQYLRARGYRGHICCGGQLSTLACDEVLAGGSGVDSVVLHDGEETFPALLAALAAGCPLEEVAGLALLGPDGAPLRTPPRPPAADLDRYPSPTRYRDHALHVGVPFIPILGSRGCWARCSFCSITAFYRGAREAGGGPALRFRSPEGIADEMAALWHGAGGRAVFCFHDDTLLLPRPMDTLARLRALRAALDVRGVGRAGLIGKCRPDTLTPALARELRALGVVRLFVGVENGSAAGVEHLGRGLELAQVHAALDACRDAGIFCCYNLLLFEPRATLADVEANIAFIRSHAEFPVNFCRAEAYSGTALQRELAAADRLAGDYLGYDYRIEDDRTEALFRICAAAFRQRNFARHGVHNRYMGLGYSAKLLEDFYPEREGRRADLVREAQRLTSAIALETAAFLERALELARELDLRDEDRCARETLRLGLAVAEADRGAHARLDRTFDEMEAYAARSRVGARPRGARLGPSVRQVAQALALASVLGASAGCGSGRPVGDAGVDAKRPPDRGIWPTDDAASPPDRTVWPTDDAPHPPDRTRPPDRIWGDADAPHPPDKAKPDEVWPVDPPPPPDLSSLEPPSGTLRAELGPELLDRWTDTCTRTAWRTADLPLSSPPHVTLAASRDGVEIQVALGCATSPLSVHWEGDGAIAGEGSAARWTPDDEADQIRVAVRARDGVAVAALRAKDVPG